MGRKAPKKKTNRAESAFLEGYRVPGHHELSEFAGCMNYNSVRALKWIFLGTKYRLQIPV
jgi:hypothetical protein